MSEKVHPASERKLSQSRIDGKVWRAQLLIQAIGIIILILLLNNFKTLVLYGLHNLVELQGERVPAMRAALADGAVIGIGFVVVGLGIVAVLSCGLTSAFGGLVISAKPISLDLERLDPVQGFARLAGELVDGWQLCLRLLFSALVLTCFALSGINVADPYSYFSALVFVVCATLLLVALFDAIMKRRRYFADLRMTEEEVRREFRDMDGDPLIKAMQRSMRESLSRGEMMKRLKRAKVLVVKRSSDSASSGAQ